MEAKSEPESTGFCPGNGNNPHPDSSPVGYLVTESESVGVKMRPKEEVSSLFAFVPFVVVN